MENQPKRNPADPEFVLTYELDAPRDLVWKVYTEAEHLAKWWGPKGFKMIETKLDLRPGGIFLYGMESPDGHNMWGKFVYREVVAPERLVFVVSFSDEHAGITRHPMSPTWPQEVLNIMTLTEHHGKTTMRIEGYPINASDAERKTFYDNLDNMRMGFAGTFQQLADYLAAF